MIHLVKVHPDVFLAIAKVRELVNEIFWPIQTGEESQLALIVATHPEICSISVLVEL